MGSIGFWDDFRFCLQRWMASVLLAEGFSTHRNSIGTVLPPVCVCRTRMRSLWKKNLSILGRWAKVRHAGRGAESFHCETRVALVSDGSFDPGRPPDVTSEAKLKQARICRAGGHDTRTPEGATAIFMGTFTSKDGVDLVMWCNNVARKHSSGEARLDQEALKHG